MSVELYGTILFELIFKTGEKINCAVPKYAIINLSKATAFQINIIKREMFTMPQMNGKYLFDTIMDCIDSNISEGEIAISSKSILREIAKATTYSIKEIKNFFKLATGDTLESYIRQRRLYYAFDEIKNNPEKPINVIADFCGYAGSSPFIRAFEAAFSVTPTKARKNPELVKDNRLVYGDFQQTEPPKRTIDDLSEKEIQRMIDLHDYMEHGLEEYGFSPELSREIAALANKLGIPVYRFMDNCFDMIVDIQSDPDYIPPEVETAIELGIKSQEELDGICRYYDCLFFELNRGMVDYYRQNVGKPDTE